MIFINHFLIYIIKINELNPFILIKPCRKFINESTFKRKLIFFT